MNNGMWFVVWFLGFPALFVWVSLIVSVVEKLVLLAKGEMPLVREKPVAVITIDQNGNAHVDADSLDMVEYTKHDIDGATWEVLVKIRRQYVR